MNKTKNIDWNKSRPKIHEFFITGQGIDFLAYCDALNRHIDYLIEIVEALE